MFVTPRVIESREVYFRKCLTEPTVELAVQSLFSPVL